MTYYLGIDIGGTFTDLVLLAGDSRVYTAKTPTTPGELQQGVLAGLQLLARESEMDVPVLLQSIDRFAHGTTVTLNALLEGKIEKTGLITTKGFESHLMLMNGERGTGLPNEEAMRYSRVRRPDLPVVPYALTRGVTERLDRFGNVVVPLDEVEVRNTVRDLTRQGVKAIAVSLLWSFRNPDHEERIAEIIREIAPDVFVSISSKVAPVIGEYERTATTAINAALGPILKDYVHHLDDSLTREGLESAILLVQSQGGLVPAQDAPEQAVSTIMSGLSAGVIGAQFVAGQIGLPNLITTDVGGTSFEVGIVHQMRPLINHTPLSPRTEAYVSRFRLRTPMVDITPIGAGGGSIAWVDDGGMLRVGPESAGAKPGPACYPGGGDRPTLTDASLLLGFLNPENFLGGRMLLDVDRARAAVEGVARKLDMEVIECARGIVAVATAQMADLVRKVTIGQGHDPRDFALFAYGGAGPTYCAYYASELGIDKIVIPGRSLASAMTALGSSLAPLQFARTQTFMAREPFDPGVLANITEDLTRQVSEQMRQWGANRSATLLETSLHIRYVGQTHELLIPVEGIPRSEEDIQALRDRFFMDYRKLYGHAAVTHATPLEITAITVNGMALPARPEFAVSDPRSEGRLSPAFRREVAFLEGGGKLTDIYRGSDLRPGDELAGPAVIEFPSTTVVVPPGFQMRTDDYLNLILEGGAAGGV